MKIAQVGLGGYGRFYLESLLQRSEQKKVRLIGGVDPFAESSLQYAELLDRGIPTFASLSDMYDAGLEPDLVVLSSPLHLHADQAILAMEHGSHVLCEKPLAATMEDAVRMIDTRDRTGRMLAVGYQWSFAPGVRQLKADIRAMRFGRPLQFRVKVYWPRGQAYYARNAWAGRIHTRDGRAVFDSPVNNACAHFIHNMLDVAGDASEPADWPATVQAELYRAHPIENFDTAVIRCQTRRGVGLFAAVSHATEVHAEPCIEYAFEGGRVISDVSTEHRLIGLFDDGRHVDYGSQPTGYDIDKLWLTVDAIRDGRSSECEGESAAAHTALTSAIQQSGTITDFGPSHVDRSSDGQSVTVPGLCDVLNKCYDAAGLPSDFEVSWARPGSVVDVATIGQMRRAGTSSLMSA